MYKGDRAKWAALAHTMKARLYLHTAERDASSYAKALAEANLGISSNAGDYVTVQTSTAGEQNDWYQFQVVGQRTSYMRAGAFGVNLLTNTNDPRLTELYQKATGAATIVGATPGQSLTSAMGNASAKRLADSYGQPLVTYNENLLIKAEALFKGGNLQAALDTLNKERASWATATPWHSAITLTPVAGSGHARADHEREVHRALPEHRDVERLQAHLLTRRSCRATAPSRFRDGCCIRPRSVRRTARTFRRIPFATGTIPTACTGR